MSLTEQEKTAILISQAMTLYSIYMQEGKIPEHQSIVDFILKTIPKQYKPKVTMELIDDIFTFISNNNMELS
ncbi:MAG: hypothetical protein KGI25_03210 [Thaumarchaeota archaeon]|nr:hypothetical protein [Nitrososphaerota archaeon]